MNRKATKILSILLVVTLAFESAGITVTAASDSADWEVTAANEDGDDMEADSDFSEGTTDGEGLGEAEGSTLPIEESYSALFPGLPESYVFSGEQLSHKDLLAQHTDEITPYVMEDNSCYYAEGELVYMTDSAEDAQTAAEAFGGTLESYDLGIAVIVLPENRTVAQAVLAASDEAVRLPAVWPNYYKELYAAYNDPALVDGQTGYQWQHEAVGDRYAWDAGYKGQGVKVGIIDSGIRNSHEEFGGRIAQHLSMLGTTASPSTTDSTGHGTHVSGIVSAAANNGKGGAGIAPQASLYVYDVVGANGLISSAVAARAINRAIQDGLDVINMSYGSPMFDGTEDTALQDAYNAGIALFAAVGDDGSNSMSYPASYSNVCAVAALRQDGKRSSFSNYNNAVDLAFPGTAIYSAAHTVNSAYDYKDGTSMACAVASGVAAVILSGADQIPALKDKTGKDRVDALYKVMRSNAKKSSSSGTGAGMTYLPSVFKLKTLDNIYATPAKPKFSLDSKEIIAANETTLTITSDTTVGVTIYYTTNGKTPALKKGIVTNGAQEYTGAITIGNAKKVTVKAIAVNHTTGKASKAASATYTFEVNPTKVDITAKNKVTQLAPGSSLSLKASVTPSCAASNKVTWSVTPADKGVSVNKAGKVSVAKDADAGIYTVLATAVDKQDAPYTNAAGSNITGSYEITVLEASAQVKSIKLQSKTASVNAGDSLNLAEGITVNYADNASGSTGDVVWSSSKEEIAAVSSAGVVTAHKSGTVTITATANDGSGKSASCKVTVKQLATGLRIWGCRNLTAGKSVTLKADFYPENVSSKKLEWTVSGTGVTVKNGKVTASKKASGRYTVTAATTDGSGISKTLSITIKKDPIKSIKTMYKNITLFTTAGNSNAPTSGVMRPIVVGGSSSNDVVYSSSAPGIVSIDKQSGFMEAKSAGKAKITCTTTDGSNKKASCTVTVSPPASSITVMPVDDNAGYVSVDSPIKLKAEVGTQFGKPVNPKVAMGVTSDYTDFVTVYWNGVVKVNPDAEKYMSDTEVSKTVVIDVGTEDGSKVQTSYSLVVLRAVKSYDIEWNEKTGEFFPVMTFKNDMQDSSVPYTATVSAPKNKHVTFKKNEETNGFFLYTDEVTTSKSKNDGDWTASDGIRVTVKLKPQAGKKTASQTYTVIHTQDGGNFVIQ